MAIEFVKHKFRPFHKIDPNVDEEREFVAGNLAETWRLTREQYLRCAEPVFNAQTATGQEYFSDSRMLFPGVKSGSRLTVKAGATEVAAKLQ